MARRWVAITGCALRNLDRTFAGPVQELRYATDRPGHPSSLEPATYRII
jgi:hypothetical protein